MGSAIGCARVTQPPQVLRLILLTALNELGFYGRRSEHGHSTIRGKIRISRLQFEISDDLKNNVKGN